MSACQSRERAHKGEGKLTRKNWGNPRANLGCAVQWRGQVLGYRYGVGWRILAFSLRLTLLKADHSLAAVAIPTLHGTHGDRDAHLSPSISFSQRSSSEVPEHGCTLTPPRQLLKKLAAWAPCQTHKLDKSQHVQGGMATDSDQQD